MPLTRDLPLPLRISVAGLGLVLLGIAAMGAFTLWATGWRWGHGLIVFACLIEGIDFIVAASRHRGGWPAVPFLILDLLGAW